MLPKVLIGIALGIAAIGLMVFPLHLTHNSRVIPKTVEGAHVPPKPAAKEVPKAAVKQGEAKEEKKARLFPVAVWTEYKAGDLAELKKLGRPVFIHLTASKFCLQCIAEWKLVNESTLKKLALEHKVSLIHADISVSDDAKELIKEFKTGGVPAYIILSGKGKVKIIQNLYSGTTLYKELDRL